VSFLQARVAQHTGVDAENLSLFHLGRRLLDNVRSDAAIRDLMLPQTDCHIQAVIKGTCASALWQKIHARRASSLPRDAHRNAAERSSSAHLNRDASAEILDILSRSSTPLSTRGAPLHQRQGSLADKYSEMTAEIKARRRAERKKKKRTRSEGRWHESTRPHTAR